MPVAPSASLSWYRRLHLWLATPIVHRLALLGGAVLIGHGYGELWDPVGSLEQVTRQVAGGMLTVTAGAALVGMLTFWRD